MNSLENPKPKVIFSGKRLTSSSLKVVFRIEKVIFRIVKLTFSRLKLTFSGEMITI